MPSYKYKENTCRICLEDNVWLDWKSKLWQFHDTTYKDCYYKYCQLERYATDPFPQKLCQNCCNALHSTHTLVLKALESHKILQGKFNVNRQFQEAFTSSANNSGFDVSHCTPVEFETILVNEDPLIYNHLEYDEDINETSKATSKAVEQANGEIAVPKNIKTKSKRKQQFEESLKEPSNNCLEMNVTPIKLKRRTAFRIKEAKRTNDNKNDIVAEMNVSKKDQIVDRNLFECDLMIGNKTEEDCAKAIVEPKFKKLHNEEPRMCSICSKILCNKKAVRKHEETHFKNRERKETCKICGLKFYSKNNLNAHMHTHRENREKLHKCEFCSKAFFNNGTLNVHRRKHLGQMIPCKLCSKQYLRQVDLDKHMTSHSATAINSDTKTQTKYFVRCPHCDKVIRSATFKSHTAAHLNEPLLKCSICDKEFFTRKCCIRHIRKVHQKSNDEYKDFIVMYTSNRISHLFFEQKTDIQIQND